MTESGRRFDTEPLISVGLLQDVETASFELKGLYREACGAVLPAGKYRVHRSNAQVRCCGPWCGHGRQISLSPDELQNASFSIEAMIGRDFHWQQREWQSFQGTLLVVPCGENGLTLVNVLPLELYLASVICSEMSAGAPRELACAHAVVSRSWLLAQLAWKGPGEKIHSTTRKPGEIIRWYDREAHADFDVCADDHCQRYHGTGRIRNIQAREAVHRTRGQVLLSGNEVCDTRYSKCCGGVTEDSRSAWSDTFVPYLVPVRDGPGPGLPRPPLSEEESFRRFVENPPDAYCNVDDPEFLDRILPSFDRKTADFFRWHVRLEAREATERIEEKLGLTLGRLRALEPVERGPSGRLKRLLLRGETGSVVIGKELEIRRVLSSSHLYSSAFFVETQGPEDRPEAFVLRGAGWGHGVGLCQVGAAVMAEKGMDHEQILVHYYPGTTLRAIYT